MSGRLWWAAAALIVVAAFGLRISYVAATPDYKTVHDARDYDRHALSIAHGEGFSEEITTKPTAFRPPGYPYLLGGVYRVFGVQDALGPERWPVARRLGVVIGTLTVVLIGILGVMWFGRRAGLIAMAIAAVYVPWITLGGSLMSEPLFVALMLGALVLASKRLAVAAGFVAGLAILTRANGMILLVPLALMLWAPRRSFGPPAVLVAVALLTVAPWTIRNAVELHAFVPVTTQFGAALAGTYNDEARTDRENPASWRTIRGVKAYLPLTQPWFTTPEVVIERRLRAASLDYIREHPTYVATVLYWNTRRLLDLASWRWSRHTASTVSVEERWADRGVVCFWIVAVLALVGVVRRRSVPWWVWAVPLVLYLSVVFTAAETPRYRAPIDPFVILLAALALTPRFVRSRPEPAQTSWADRTQGATTTAPTAGRAG
jgi:4-amino-4-deoxy-L-arabinose transferase-like glycosyltransferase